MLEIHDSVVEMADFVQDKGYSRQNDGRNSKA